MKKFDEIKEAISSNTTPVKTTSTLETDNPSVEDLLNDDGNATRSRRVSSEFDLWGRLSESRKSSYNNLVPLGENTSTSNSYTYPVLPENFYPQNAEVIFRFTI